MDETLNQMIEKNKSAKSPTLTIANQSGNNLHLLSNQKERMTVYSKQPLKSSLSISKNNNNSSFCGEEANI